MEYMNDHFEDIGRVTFFLHESVPKDRISDTWHKVADFYLGNDRRITPDNVHNIMDVSAM